MSNIVIGIEGYVGAGKSAICRELLNHIPNSIILEGGNLYRAIVYSLLKSGIDLSNLKQNMSHVDIKSIMEKLKLPNFYGKNMLVFIDEFRTIKNNDLTKEQNEKMIKKVCLNPIL